MKNYILTVFLVLASAVDTVGAQIDFNVDAAQNVDLRIATKHNSAVNKKVYGAMTWALYQQRKFTRNTQCWAYDLDLTCASAFNSRGGMQRAGTLITPRHLMLAAHFPFTVGDSVFFITKDNQTVRRKVIGEIINTDVNTYYPDIQLVTLDADVPTTIVPCQFLPANYGQYLANDGAGLPTLYFDQDENALVGEVNQINSYSSFSQQTPINANRLALYEDLITGDSGDPVFLILSGKLVLLNCITFGGAGSGISLTYFANIPTGRSLPDMNINDLIKLSDANGKVSTGYEIKYFDFTGTAAIEKTTKPEDKVFVNNRSLQVVLADRQDNTQVLVTDVLGRIITKQRLFGLSLNYELKQNGAYMVILQHGTDRETYKVLVK